jgi:hypothetical protein
MKDSWRGWGLKAEDVVEMRVSAARGGICSPHELSVRLATNSGVHVRSSSMSCYISLLVPPPLLESLILSDTFSPFETQSVISSMRAGTGSECVHLVLHKVHVPPSCTRFLGCISHEDPGRSRYIRK